jgi:MFS superfamily sulfate permease-like transporter
MVRDEGALTADHPGVRRLPFGPRRLHLLPELAGTAIAISILGMLEAASITKGLAAKSGQKIEPNQELIGMGAANIACAFFGAVPGSSSFARSAVNYQSGARTQMSSMLSSVVVLGILTFVTPVFNFIPIAALAAHLIRIGFNMINWHQIRISCRSTPSDLVVFVVTLGSCLFLRLDTAIYVGIGVSLALFLQKTSTPTLVEYAINESGNLVALDDPSQRLHPQISIIHVEGELFFGAADLFQEQVRSLADNQNIRVFILRMKNARHLDASTVMAHGEPARLPAQDRPVPADQRKQPRGHAGAGQQRAPPPDRQGEHLPGRGNPTVATRNALKRAKELLPGESLDVRVFYDKKPCTRGLAPHRPHGAGRVRIRGLLEERRRLALAASVCHPLRHVLRAPRTFSGRGSREPAAARAERAARAQLPAAHRSPADGGPGRRHAMKRGLLVLLLGLAVGVAAHTVYFRLHLPPNSDSIDAQLVWMKRELQLSDGQFARIRELHEASSPRLRALASQVAQMQAEFAAFENTRRATDRVDFIEFARFVEARRSISRQCLDSTRQLVRAAANEMTPVQRERYLGIVSPAEPTTSDVTN